MADREMGSGHDEGPRFEDKQGMARPDVDPLQESFDLARLNESGQLPAEPWGGQEPSAEEPTDDGQQDEPTTDYPIEAQDQGAQDPDAPQETKGETARIEELEKELQFFRPFRGLLTKTATDRGLQQVIHDYLAGQNQGPKLPSLEEEFSDLEDGDRQLLTRMMSSVLKRVVPIVEERVGPIRQTQEQNVLTMEWANLDRSHPEWKDHVSQEELEMGKEARPDWPLEAIYKNLAFESVKKRVADPRRQRIQNALGRTPPARVPRGTPRKPQRELNNMDDAWDQALEDMGLAAPPRR